MTQQIKDTPLTDDNKKNGWRLAFTVLSMGIATVLVVGGFATMLAGIIEYSEKGHDYKVLLAPIIVGSIALILGVLSFFIDTRYSYLSRQARLEHDKNYAKLEAKIDLQTEIINQQNTKIELLESQNKQLIKEIDILNKQLKKYNIERDAWD